MQDSVPVHKFLDDFIDIPEFKKGIQEFKLQLQASMDRDPDDSGELDDLMQSVTNLETAFSHGDTTEEIGHERLALIAQDLMAYLKCRANPSDDEFQNGLDFDEEIYRELEEIDLDDFQVELSHFKAMILEEFETNPTAEPEDIQSREEIAAMIKNLEDTLGSISDLSDLSEEQIEAIRPDFDHYEQISSELFSDENDDFGDEYPELEDLNVEVFKQELVEMKPVIIEIFGLNASMDLKHEDSDLGITQIIEKLEAAFSPISSIGELSEEQIEAIRPEYLIYQRLASIVLNFTDEDDDDFDDADLLDDDYLDALDDEDFDAEQEKPAILQFINPN